MVSELVAFDATVSSRGAPPPFFIMGCPRSGTTLVAQLLNNHSRIAVFVESMYYPLFRPDLHRYGDLRRASNLRRLIDNFREMVYLHGLYQVEPPSTEEILAALVAPTFEAVLTTFLQLYALRQGKARCGEKTARHSEYLPEIQEKLPDSPIVFVMRDPRDAVFSIRKMFDARVETGVEWWNQAFRRYQRVAETAYLLRYEELVRSPQPALERLSAFLGEEYDPRMLDFFRHVPERLRHATQHRKLLTPVDAASVGRFREMPDAEIEQIESACAFGMEAMGYAPMIVRTGRRSNPPRKRTGRLRSTLERLRRFQKRPDLLRLGWRRWKMRFRVCARYILTFGPFRQAWR